MSTDVPVVRVDSVGSANVRFSAPRAARRAAVTLAVAVIVLGLGFAFARELRQWAHQPSPGFGNGLETLSVVGSPSSESRSGQATITPRQQRLAVAIVRGDRLFARLVGDNPYRARAKALWSQADSGVVIGAGVTVMFPHAVDIAGRPENPSSGQPAPIATRGTWGH